MLHHFIKLALVITVIAMAGLGTGCASILKGSTSSIDVHSNPPGSEVYINGARVGVTPVSLKMASDQNYKLEIKHTGYMPRTFLLESSVGAGWVILDIFAAGLIGVVVDAATGNWKTLSPSEISTTLVPAP